MTITKPTDHELFYGGYLKSCELLIADIREKGGAQSEINHLADCIVSAQSWSRDQMRQAYEGMAANNPDLLAICMQNGRQLFEDFTRESEGVEEVPITLEALHSGLITYCETTAEQLREQADPEAAVELQRIETLLPHLRASDAKTAAKAFQWLSEHDPEMVRAAITHALDLRDELTRLESL